MMSSMSKDFKPVFVWITAGTQHAVGDVVRAAEILLKRWPEEFAESGLHHAARLACLDAWQNDGDLLGAREAFVAAAQEAGVLAPEEAVLLVEQIRAYAEHPGEVDLGLWRELATRLGPFNCSHADTRPSRKILDAHAHPLPHSSEGRHATFYRGQNFLR